MSSQPVGPTYYADFGGLESLKKGVKADDPKAIRAAAQQFESLFTDMMLKSMREAKLGEGLGDTQESDLYQDMYDQQLSLKMAQGKGMGLAEMLVQQLTRNGAAKAAAAAAPAATGSATGSAAGATGATGAAGAAGAGSATPSHADRISFVKKLAPFAERAAGQLGVSSDTLIAQAALETGWGQHIPAASNGSSSFNLFGIKAGADWDGNAVNAPTTEYIAGTGGGPSSLTQPFRQYSSVQQGVNDYVTLLQRHSRYQQALGAGDNVSAFAGALMRGGYATDPAYAQKLQAMAATVKSLRAAAGGPSLKVLAGLPTTVGGESS
ncbi:MAG TPA: flagellar assembly peptidoglycan hydrolase FlgJ [Steroidobacteraceae bacterium]